MVIDDDAIYRGCEPSSAVFPGQPRLSKVVEGLISDRIGLGGLNHIGHIGHKLLLWSW
jgi:hypothetical protein